MIPGETIASGAPSTCPDCGVKLVPKILRSFAGHYIGTACNCGPYSRESEHFRSLAEAEEALAKEEYDDSDDFYDEYVDDEPCDCPICKEIGEKHDLEEDEGENYDGDPLEREGLYDEFN